jgi:hypothetical protein
MAEDENYKKAQVATIGVMRMNNVTAWSGWRKKLTTTKFTLPKITCEDGAYHLSKALISDYGVVVCLCV